MKDKNGIEIKCVNCFYNCRTCKDEDCVKCKSFMPVYKLLEARIAELQAQQFTRGDLKNIKRHSAAFQNPAEAFVSSDDVNSIITKCNLVILKGKK